MIIPSALAQPRRSGSLWPRFPSLLLQGCVPLVVAGGAGGAAMVATDRRSTGTQLDDEVIEDKIVATVTAALQGRLPRQRHELQRHRAPDRRSAGRRREGGHRRDRATTPEGACRAERAGRRRRSPIWARRSNDTLITSKVKARFVEANKFQINHVKVVTERGVVYLMGLVRRDEGDAAGEIARTTSGAQRVVKVFEYIAG